MLLTEDVVRTRGPSVFVHEAAIDAGNGDCSGTAAHVDHFPQDMGTVAFRHRHLLGAIIDSIGGGGMVSSQKSRILEQLFWSGLSSELEDVATQAQVEYLSRIVGLDHGTRGHYR